MEIFKIDGVIKKYDWGSQFLTQQEFPKYKEFNNQKIAEIWFGTHKDGESLVCNTQEKFSNFINYKLSFLLKIISVAKPLSIQVHPSNNFIKSNKNAFIDSLEKPEIIYAISDFELLAGYKSSKTVFNELSNKNNILAKEIAYKIKNAPSRLNNSKIFENIFYSVLNKNTKENQQRIKLFVEELNDPVINKIYKIYGFDPGVVFASFLQLYKIKKGNALFTPVGCVHSYLNGIGIEVMTESNNVARLALTKKEVDSQLFFNTIITKNKIVQINSKELSLGFSLADNIEFIVLTNHPSLKKQPLLNNKNNMNNDVLVGVLVEGSSVNIIGKEISLELKKGDVFCIKNNSGKNNFNQIYCQGNSSYKIALVT